MGVLDFANAAPATNRNSSAARGDRPQAKVWLNIGYTVPGPDGDRFVSLPVGLPIDTMEAQEAKGQNEDWIKFVHAKNGLLKTLQAAGDALAPGEEKIIGMGDSGLSIQLRRANEERVVEAGENEYTRSFSF